ncbi:MAG: class I SAM-dependent methyltransferase [Pricia sp.]|nr:class I SAM-dependent methyltransferase [Pricia sp.]
MKDNFSAQSKLYSRFRPTYPNTLLDYICDFVAKKDLAWDCATGNGQVALQIAKDFKKVIATDISKEQIKNATKHDNIIYKIEQAENSSLKNASVDLVIVAQAIHWFDFDSFYKEVKRVLRPNGIIAVIGYGFVQTENPKLTMLIRHFYEDIVGPYWDEERKYVDDHYVTIPFPFEEIAIPKFEMKYKWTSAHLLGYLESWSAVAHYRRKNKSNPVDLIRNQLEKMFSNGRPVEVSFGIIGRMGKI